MVNRASATSDAALGLPVDALNTEYILLNYGSSASHQIGEALVAPPYDNTDVTITPSAALTSHAASVPFTITLQSGEGYLIKGLGSITGTTFEANRPVSVTNGNRCANIGGQGVCDHVFEVAQPVQTWGKEILAANLPLRAGGTIYRIIASEDGTNVLQNGSSIGTINRGQFIETAKITGSHIFSSAKPIYVGQFMTGQPGGGTGDPAFGNLIPFAQFGSAYTFSAPGGGQFAQNFVTIYAQNGDASAGSVNLDGSPVPAGDFATIGTTGWSSAIKTITSGTHTTSSPNPHGITVEGYNSYDSYLYPGGALFQFINPVGDANPPIVTDNLVPGPPPQSTAQPPTTAQAKTQMATES